MSSRGATMSEPAFARERQHHSLLFGVMDHSAKRRRPAPETRGSRRFPRMADERNTASTSQRSDVHCRPEAKLNREKRPCARTSRNPLEKRRRRGQRLARNSGSALGREHGALRLGLSSSSTCSTGWSITPTPFRCCRRSRRPTRLRWCACRGTCRHHHEVARRRRLRRRLPDDQHAGRTRGVHPESAAMRRAAAARSGRSGP